MSDSSDTASYPAYKNRWIALVRNRVVGVGTDQGSAHSAAKQVCPKDRPALYFVDENGHAFMQPDQFNIWFDHDILKKITQIWQRQGQQGYLVGGAVRDGLLGHLPPEADLDLLVPENALAVSRSLANKLGAAYYPVDPKRDVGRIVFTDQRHADIASFRAETLSGDLQDRDFTVNAIALVLDQTSPRLIDPLGGQSDLARKIIRVASKVSIKNDPLRSVRGVRLAAELGFDIETETATLISEGGVRLTEISPERLRDEVLKLLSVKKPGQAIEQLRGLGLLAHILPEALAMVDVAQSYPHYQPVFNHTLAVMDHAAALVRPDDPRLEPLEALKPKLQTYFRTQLAGNLSRASLMPLVGLLHDIGKPATFQQGSDGRIRFWGHPQTGAETAERVLARWRLSGQASQFVLTAIRNHMRSLLLTHQERPVTPRAIHRFLESTGNAAPAIAIFSLVDHLGVYREGDGADEWQKLIEVVRKICEGYFSPKLPVLLTGKEVIRLLNLEPGPHVGELLRKVKEAQAVGEISSTEEAIEFVKAQPVG